MTLRPAREQGFSLVAAVFLLVVLAGLGVYAVRINTLQQQTVTAGLRASQAYHAARSGIAEAAYRAVNGGGCTTEALTLTEGALAGFRVAVQCAETTHAEGASTVRVLVFSARAEAGVYGGPDYVSRRLETKIVDVT